MLEIARDLARRGFKVFPIKAGEKKPPLVPGWQHAATTHEAQIVSWWTQWPQANVGIHCDGFIVVDIDPKKGGYESLARLDLELDLPATYEVSTPSGGRHLYYRYGGEQCRNGVDILGPGLDIRTTNGYVVAAGSRTHVGDYRVQRDGDPAVAPAALAARCMATKVADTPLAPVETDADTAVARAQLFLETHPVAIEGKGGDDHTYKTVARVKDFGVPQERMLEAMGPWNKRCEPPWDAADLSIKITNAFRYGQNTPGNLTPEALGFEPVENAGQDLQQPQPDELRDLMHPADLKLGAVLGADYLIKGVLEKQSNAVLFGQWNAGKTFVVLDMAASIATGTKWFGKRVRPGRVLYLGYEGLRAMSKRLIALRGKYPALNDVRTPFRYEGLTIPLTRPEGVQEIGKILRSFGALHGGAPDLVIIDPLANALGGDDADAMLMGKLNEVVAEIMRRQRCTVLRVHHSGHGNQDRARGHSSLPAGVDTEIRVSKGEIFTSKQRDDVTGGMLHFTLSTVVLGKDSDNDDVTTCVVVEVENNPMDPKLTQPERELLDKLLEMHGTGGRATNTDIKDCTPDLTAAQHRPLVRALLKKQYLRADGRDFIIAERGPMAAFD